MSCGQGLRHRSGSSTIQWLTLDDLGQRGFTIQWVTPVIAGRERVLTTVLMPDSCCSRGSPAASSIILR